MTSRILLTLVMTVTGVAGTAGRAAQTSPLADPATTAPRDQQQPSILPVSLADHRSELSGVTVGIEGRPWPGCLVAVVPGDVDPQLRSRDARLVRTDRGGRFAVRDLPAGSYLVTASPDVNPTTWLTPAFFDRLARLAARVVLADREKKDVTLPCARLP